MNVSFQNANPSSGRESYYLGFRDRVDDATACVLVDSGANVSTARDLGGEEYLSAILLTHAHLDHYETLADNVTDGAPILTSPSTAAAIETIHTEAEDNYGLGDTESVLEAIEPIRGWYDLRDDLSVHPVPAGHAPGAVGFLVRFLDAGTAHHLLVTGDFTRTAAGGYPPLPTEFPVDIDALFVNGAVDAERTAPAIVERAIERAQAGSTVLLTTGGLSGVEYAYRLGHAIDAGGASIPVTVVGQIAKLYADLEYDVPNVEAIPTFEDPESVMRAGGICLAGPEVPIDGSAKRLFGEIRDDPGGTLLQVTSADEPTVTDGRCTVYEFEHTSHPTIEEIDAVVESLVPIQTVVQHGNRRQFKDRFEFTFTWVDATTETHELYDNGRWQRPPWVSKTVEERIRQQYRKRRGYRIGDIFGEEPTDRPELPEIGRLPAVDLEAEGIDREAIAPQRSRPVLADAAGDGGELRTAGGSSNGEESTGADESEGGSQREGGRRRDLHDRLDTIESMLREPTGGRELSVRVVDAGDGDVFFRLLEPVDGLEHGERLTVRFDR